MWGLRLKPLPVALFGVTVGLEAIAVPLSLGLESQYDTLLYALYSVSLAGAGALIRSRHPRNAIGWLFLAGAIVTAAGDAAQGWGLRASAEGWPGAALGEWINEWAWLPSGMGWTLTFLLFPDGRLPDRRWRVVVWLGLAGLALALPAWALDPDRGSDFTSGRNPMAVEGLPTGGLLAIGSSLFLSALVASVVSLVLRIPRSQGAERQQIKWFAFAAAVAGVVLPLSLLFWDKGGVFRVLPAFALTGLPIAACIAILRYRLYDIDVVINRTLVYGGLTLLLAAAWAASALLLGTALGRGSAWSTAGATLVAAIAFSPLRERLQDAVDRRFNRARYEALRQIDGFLQELRAGRAAPEGVEQVLREVLCDNEIELRFFLPESELYVDSRGVPATDLPQDARSQIMIERGGRPLAMVLHNPATQREPTLLSRVVEAGDLAIEIARLRVEVRRQLNEVRASRTRIVDATNEERRRIERDLHDGAQQRLVSIGLALRHAQHELACSSPAGAGRTLDGAVTEVELAIEELRELARGLPPAQLDHGLRPALRELASRAPFPVEVHAAPERFAVGVEAAAYFIACEGLTNAIKHAGASKVVLEAGRQNGNLVVSVADDGIGGAAPTDGSGLSGLADRVIAQGGTLRIDSRRGAGTRLTAELPCES